MAKKTFALYPMHSLRSRSTDRRRVAFFKILVITDKALPVRACLQAIKAAGFLFKSPRHLSLNDIPSYLQSLIRLRASSYSFN